MNLFRLFSTTQYSHVQLVHQHVNINNTTYNNSLMLYVRVFFDQIGTETFCGIFCIRTEDLLHAAFYALVLFFKSFFIKLQMSHLSIASSWVQT